VAAIKAPRYGEERRGIMDDLATATGGYYFKKSRGDDIKNVEMSHFGSAKSIEISKLLTTVVGGNGDIEKVEERIEALKIKVEATESLPEAERVQERITRLASGVAVIRVGAATEIEMIEKKHRIEDALEAVRSAQLEGVVAGGGISLLRIGENLEVETDTPEQAIGVAVIKEALQAPVRQMAINCGLSEDVVVNNILSESGNIGMNFSTGEMVDMFNVGIIDPAKVTKCAVINAISVSGILLTTNHAIVETNN